ncbi:alpha/beta hydrolase [Actinophytocola glycyrrhizae]|uniref:Alpha/beta hydrolase n=1 Tax=Actinophytocola glycyrrhizae TaxID=2044873 RepID=A0ABV9S6G0_9PSEU
MSAPVRADRERPLYLAAGPDRVFGVHTTPPGEASGVGVLMLSGGVYVLSTNRNRLFVRLARQLAGEGHHALRIDYRGVGESTGVIGGYALDDPNPLDVRAALDHLTAAGARRLVAVGSCYGARAAMHVAADEPALAAMVLFAPPVGDAGRGEAPTPDLVGDLFVDRLRTLAARRVPTLLVYGEDDNYHRDFQAASGVLGELFAPGSSLVVATLPGKAHGLQRVSTQDALLDMTVRFLSTSV